MSETWHKKDDSKSEQRVKACKEQTEQQDWRAAEGLFRAEAKTPASLRIFLSSDFTFCIFSLELYKQNKTSSNYGSTLLSLLSKYQKKRVKVGKINLFYKSN